MTTLTPSKTLSDEPIVSPTCPMEDRKSTRLNSSHLVISYAVFCLKKKKKHSLLILIVHQDIPGELLLVFFLSNTYVADISRATQRPYIGATSYNSQSSVALLDDVLP